MITVVEAGESNAQRTGEALDAGIITGIDDKVSFMAMFISS